MIAAITDVGSELLFFCLLSVVTYHAYYASTLCLSGKLSPVNFQWISAVLNVAFGAALIGQLWAFGYTGLEGVEVRLFDDRNRFLYFWIVGIGCGILSSYPLYRKRLIAMDRGFLPQR